MRQLFDRVYPILVRFVHRRVRDVDLAEDIAQDAFVRLLTEHPDKPQAWLFTVAGNLAKNAMRGVGIENLFNRQYYTFGIEAQNALIPIYSQVPLNDSDSPLTNFVVPSIPRRITLTCRVHL